MGEKRIIKLNLANRKYPIRVSKHDESEEEIIRKAAKLVDEKLKQYQKKFSNREIIDILAMTSLQIAQELILTKRSSESAVNVDNFIELSDRLDEILEE